MNQHDRVTYLFLLGDRYESYVCLFHSAIELTVWKLQNFSITQIFREIIFGDSRNAKMFKNQNSEPLNEVKWQILHF